MKDLLHPRHRDVLERLAASRALVALDYDGVLAPLVRHPGGTRMRPATRRLLAQLARAWPVAVISGRAFVDTLRLSEGVAPHVVGNHGYELLRARAVPRAVVARVAGWRADLERDLAEVRGWFIEDKRSTLAVHYGLERRWRGTEGAVRRAAARLQGARLVAGKKVLNVIPAAFPNKGDAVQALLARLGLDVALFLGDDVTDEDAFSVGPPRVIGVRVGHGRSLAPWRIGSQEQVDELLRVLVGLRRRERGEGRAEGGARGKGDEGEVRGTREREEGRVRGGPLAGASARQGRGREGATADEPAHPKAVRARRSASVSGTR